MIAREGRAVIPAVDNEMKEERHDALEKPTRRIDLGRLWSR